MAVELGGELPDEDFEALEEDRIAVVGLPGGLVGLLELHVGAVAAHLAQPAGRGVWEIRVAFVAAHAESEVVAFRPPFIEDRIYVGPVVDILLRFDVAPVDAQVEVVQAGEILQVIARFMVPGVAVVGPAIAVVDVVPVPSLVGVAQDALVILNGAKVDPVFCGIRCRNSFD